MNPLDLLKPFAHPDTRYPFTSSPFVYREVAYATDCRCMVSLPAPGEADTSGVSGKFLAALPGMYPPHEPTGFDVDDIRQWVGPVPPPEPCYVCGTYDPPLPPEAHPMSHLPNVKGPGCELCEGSGFWPKSDTEPVRVFGSVFDAIYLRRFLAAPFAAGVFAGTFGRQRPSNPLSPASFTVGPARMLLMPMDIPAERHPAHPLYVPGIGPLWHLRNTNKRFVLEDWCEERGHTLTELEGTPARAGEGEG